MMRFAPTVSVGKSAEQALDELQELFSAPWHDRMQEAADLIGSLRRDGSLLRSFISRVVARGAWPDLTGAQSFTLRSNEVMLVRINLWFAHGDTASEGYRKYLSIEEIHNHDFDFFTTCLFGPGYRSTFWQDPGFHTGRRVGEKIELKEERHCALTGDDVWFVAASDDYHSQHWPDGFSVTLNVLPNWLERPTTIQYVLDEQHRIKTVIDSSLPRLDLAA